jgi:hypothetical protein
MGNWGPDCIKKHAIASCAQSSQKRIDTRLRCRAWPRVEKAHFGIFDCCARTGSGHAAAASPTMAMNSRRFMAASSGPIGLRHDNTVGADESVRAKTVPTTSGAQRLLKTRPAMANLGPPTSKPRFGGALFLPADLQTISRLRAQFSADEACFLRARESPQAVSQRLRRSGVAAVDPTPRTTGLGQWPRLNNAAPSLQPHYRAFDATTGCSAPALRFGTLALAVGAACGLSLHAVGVTKRRFSRSIAGRASRRLHAGCRSGSIRASPELIPEEGHPPVP